MRTDARKYQEVTHLEVDVITIASTHCLVFLTCIYYFFLSYNKMVWTMI